MSNAKWPFQAVLMLLPLAAHAEGAKAPEVNVSGMLDAYYMLNLDQPQSRAHPTKGYTGEPGFNLNFAKLSTVATLDPVTLRLDLGFGPQGAAIGNHYVQQAFASMKFGRVTVDAGRFVTPAGFEVYESKDNWLHSTGLIFNFAVPTAHEGVRAAVPIGETLTLTGYLANGSDLYANDVGATRSPYKTGILSLGYAKDDTTAALTAFYAMIPGTEDERALLIDAVVTQGLGDLSVNLSGDYGQAYDTDSAWYAVGASARYALGGPIAVAARAEYLNDEDGIRTGLAPAQGFFEVTGGVSYAVGSNASLRAELRYDRADEPVYHGEDGMTVLHLAAITWF